VAHVLARFIGTRVERVLWSIVAIDAMSTRVQNMGKCFATGQVTVGAIYA